jgi:protein-S-isoprenylcysteine O-methyltransferase Ste14
MEINNKTKSLLMDIIQISSLLFFAFTGPMFSSNPLIVIFQISAFALIILAVWEMRRNKFYRVPDIGRQDRLVTGGIYRCIRHPMYTSQILFVGTLLVNYFSLFRLVVFILLFVNFLLKIRYEENLLMEHFSGYLEYRKKSYRLIPFLY